MKYQWIKTYLSSYPLMAMCRVLKVCRSGFYAWVKLPAGRPSSRSESLLESIRQEFENSGEVYGSPRVAMALVARGIRVCVNTVARCMKEHGIRVKPTRRYVPRTTQTDASLKPSPNLLDRDFEATGVNQKWCSDITYVRTDEGWLYVAMIKDLYSKKIIGWAMEGHMRVELTLAALAMAIQKRGSFKGVIHHSDRGKQYAGADYRAMLNKHQITQSMSGTGDCYDNAPAESFFASLKKELVNLRTFKTLDEAKHEVFVYIEGFYNRTRLHSAIGYVSPEKFEAA